MKGFIVSKGVVNKNLAILLSIALIAALLIGIMAISSAFSNTELAYASTGTGTASDPFLVSTRADLEDISSGLDKCYKLTKDIYLGGSSSPWTPIDGQFTGTLDGDGHKITGLYVSSTSNQQGLFRYIQNGTVMNLTIDGSITTLGGKVGGIAGECNGAHIISCQNNVNITGNYNLGGICGYSVDSVIEKCFNTGNILAVNDSNADAGGIVGAFYKGSSSASISNCYNIGTISSSGTQGERYLGGIAGDIGVNTSISYCHNMGSLSGTPSDKAGYITGAVLSGSTVTLANNYYLGKGTAINGVGRINNVEQTADVAGRFETLSESDFANQSKFSSWDFINTWEMRTIGSKTYPMLKDYSNNLVVRYDDISCTGDTFESNNNITTSSSYTLDNGDLKFTIENNYSVTIRIALTSTYDFHLAEFMLKSQGSGIKVSYDYLGYESSPVEIGASNDYQDVSVYLNNKGTNKYAGLSIKFKNESGENRDLYIKSIDTYWIGNPYVITIVAEGATDLGAGKFYAAYGLGYFRDAQLKERVESGYGTDGVYVQMPKKTGYRLINTCTQLNDGDAILGTNGSLMNAVSGNYRYFTEDSNVYSYFRIHTGPIYLYPNGGAFADNEERHKLGEGDIDWGTTLPTVTDLPSKAGYDFAGFFDAETGGTKYIGADGVCVKTWDKEAGGWSTNLYAQYTVSGSDPTPQEKVDPQTPTGIEAAYGQILDKVALPKDWSWVDGTQNVGTFGEHIFKANYTPTGDDANTYNAKTNVDITVNVKWILVDPTQDEVSITIKGGDDSYDINITVKVEVQTKIQEKQNEYNITLSNNEKIAGIYGVKLLRKTIVSGQEVLEEIQPSDIKEGAKIQAVMKIPESAKGKTFKVLHIHSAEDIQEIAYTLSADGNSITIETDKLSDFAFVVEENPSHGFCIGWVVFIFMILELLATAVYVIVRYHLLDEVVKKCKLECLFDKLDLLTLIGLCVAGGIFLFALIALCVHQCAVTIISFIFTFIICGGFTYFFLNDKGIIDKLLKKQPKVEDKKEEVKDEPNDTNN